MRLVWHNIVILALNMVVKSFSATFLPVWIWKIQDLKVWMINFYVSFLLSKQEGDLIVISPRNYNKACHNFGVYFRPCTQRSRSDHAIWVEDELSGYMRMMLESLYIWNKILSEIAIFDYIILERRVKTKLYIYCTKRLSE